jgi:hypothetical protein
MLWCARDTSPGVGTCPPRSAPRRRRCGAARDTGVVTAAARALVRPTTQGMRVVSNASARRIAGNMVVNRRASLDVPTPGDPRRRLWSERLHDLQLYRSL